jgi:hypothetical protein
MTKRPGSNGKPKPLSDLPATDSRLHPGNFPIGSLESRAAARAFIRPGHLRAGDRGTDADSFWWVIRDEESGRLIKIIFPRTFKHLAKEQSSPPTSAIASPRAPIATAEPETLARAEREARAKREAG